MKIGINALYWRPNGMGGTQTYFLNLVQALIKTHTDHEICVFLNADGADKFPFASPKLKIVRCFVPGQLRPLRLLWEYMVLPYYAKRQKLQILHSLGYISPIVPKIPLVVTVLDMIHYVRPKETGAFKQLLWRILFPLSLRTVNRIITISQNVGQEICANFPWAASKVIPIHLGVDHELFRIPDCRKGAGDTPFVLAVASIQPHKNLDGLIKAFAKVRQHLPYTRLVLVGMKTPTHEKLLKLIEALSLDDAVGFTGRISDQELIDLYQNAAVMVFPSLYEGFGLPILEAMACGCPVIASDCSVFREVAGDAALLINPEDYDELMNAMIKVINNEAIRSSLIGRGLKHVKIYTWEKTAEQTVSVYHDACLK